jgi:predicted glycosyltransferase
MKVWYDACTGKHMRYGIAIAQRLRKAGHKVILTTREHPDTLPLARALGEKPIVVRKYAPASLFSRLEESAHRMLKFSEMFKDDLPDVAIAHQSIELCRTAFGLGVPIVLTADTPHATAVNRLTIPLAKVLVASEAIPKRLFKSYGQQNVVQFRGVDEVAWVKDSKPMRVSGHKRPLIMVRQMETQATYALGKSDDTLKLAEKLTSLGDVIFFSRYKRVDREEFTVVKEFVDTVSAVARADLVLSVGGTISREAALQGVPSIVITEMGRTYVNRYLAEKGFPLFTAKSSQVLNLAKKYLGKRFDVKAKLAELENPVDVIERIIKEKQHA